MCIVCLTVMDLEHPNRVKTESVGERVRVSCRRCGDYLVRDKFLKAHNSRGFPVNEALALSAAIRDATNHEEAIELSDENLARITGATSGLSYTARVDRILLDLARRNPFPGSQTGPFQLEELAAIACVPTKQISGLMVQLSQAGWLGIAATEPDRYKVTVAPQAWQRLDELQSKGPRGQKAFVAMAFSEDLKPVYFDAIRPALVACGYEPPFRVDDAEHEARASDADFKNKIDDRIMAEIRRAKFLIVDVTLARPAVYFEAGFAEGLGVPIIWTCREESKDDMCFDTRQNGHVLWKDPAHLKEQLLDKLRARGWDRSSQA